MTKTVNIQRRPLTEMTPKQKAALERLWARLLTKKTPEDEIKTGNCPDWTARNAT